MHNVSIVVDRNQAEHILSLLALKIAEYQLAKTTSNIYFAHEETDCRKLYSLISADIHNADTFYAEAEAITGRIPSEPDNGLEAAQKYFNPFWEGNKNDPSSE